MSVCALKEAEYRVNCTNRRSKNHQNASNRLVIKMSLRCVSKNSNNITWLMVIAITSDSTQCLISHHSNEKYTINRASLYFLSQTIVLHMPSFSFSIWIKKHQQLLSSPVHALLNESTAQIT